MPVFGWSANHQFTAKNYRTDIFWQFLATKTGRNNKAGMFRLLRQRLAELSAMFILGL